MLNYKLFETEGGYGAMKMSMFKELSMIIDYSMSVAKLNLDLNEM